MDFNEASIHVRQVGNGVMFVSSIVLLIATVRYLIVMRRKVGAQWLSDIGVQGALAVSIMLIGYSFRAFGSWIDFIFIDRGWTAPFSNWLSHFIAATVLIVAGKMTIVYFFTNPRWRLCAMLGALVVSLSIPIGIAVYLS